MNHRIVYEIDTLIGRTQNPNSQNRQYQRRLRALQRLEASVPVNHKIHTFVFETEYEDYLDNAGRERTRVIQYWGWEVWNCAGGVIASHEETEFSESHAQQVAQNCIDRLIADF